MLPLARARALKSFTPRKPFHRRRKRQSNTPPPHPGLLVTAVTVGEDSPLHVTVTFSASVEFVGPGVPENFLVQIGGGGGEFLPVADVLDSGADWIEFLFLADVAVGAAWKIVGPMEGIAPEVAWPQAGSVG